MQILNPISVIVASGNSGDGCELRAFLRDSPWELIHAATTHDAVRELHRIPLPIVLCDENLDGRAWRDTVRMLNKARRKTCVVLLSDAAGPELYQSVIHRGGFDVLSRPFDRHQVFATLICAYSQCRVHLAAFARVERLRAPVAAVRSA